MHLCDQLPLSLRAMQKIKILHHRQLAISLGLLLSDLVVFLAINPRQASALWLIIGYLMFSATIVSLADLLALSLKGYGRSTRRTAKRTLRYAAAVIIAIIGLQSIGQLTVKDVATLLPVVVLFGVYAGYGKKPAPE